MRNHGFDNNRALLLTVALWIMVFLLILAKLANSAQIEVPAVEQHIKRNCVKVDYVYGFQDKLGIFHWRSGYCVGALYDGNKAITVSHIVHEKPQGSIRVWAWNMKTKQYDIMLDNDAKILKFDIKKDLLLLELERGVSWKTFEIADSLSMGEDLMFFGLNGMFLPRLRYIKAMIDEFRSNEILIHPMYWGDSGGPVCNSAGELVGFITKIYFGVHGYLIYNDLIGGAMPLDEIRKFLE